MKILISVRKELSFATNSAFLNPISLDIFRTMNSVRSNNISLKYQRFTTLRSKDIGIINSEFVAKTQFLCFRFGSLFFSSLVFLCFSFSSRLFSPPLLIINFLFSFLKPSLFLSSICFAPKFKFSILLSKPELFSLFQNQTYSLFLYLFIVFSISLLT